MELRLCRKFNLTWSLVKLTPNEFVSFDQSTGRFAGKAKHLVEGILLLRKHESLDEPYSRCRIILADKYGNRYVGNDSRESYDGAIGQIQRAQADILLRAGSYFIDPTLLDFSVSIKPDRYLSFQLIDTKKPEKRERFLQDVYGVLAPKFDFFLFYSLIILVAFLIAVYLLRRTYRRQAMSLASFCRMSLNILVLQDNFTRKLNAFTLFIAWFMMFNFLIRLLLQNNIKTSQVVVDTSELITDREKLLNTRKELCLMENGQDSDYFTFAPKNTFANIVFEKLTNRTKTCYVRDGRNFFVFGKHFNKFFVLASEFIIKVASSFLENLNQKDSFHSDIYFFEFLKAFYLRKNLSRDVRRYLDECFEFLIEQGFFDKFFENFSVLMQNFDKSYKSFTNLEEYVNEYSYNLNISVKSFTFLFFVYILLNSLVLLLFGLLAIRKSLRIWASSCYWSTRKRCQRLSAVQLASCTPPPFRYRWKGPPRCQMAACAPLHFRYRCVYY